MIELKIYNETLHAVFSDCCDVLGGYRPGCDCRKCVQNRTEIRVESEINTWQAKNTWVAKLRSGLAGSRS